LFFLSFLVFYTLFEKGSPASLRSIASLQRSEKYASARLTRAKPKRRFLARFASESLTA
jgi:hypothetical protein